MTEYLLDVNALVALLSYGHSSHKLMLRWFTMTPRLAWVTCPLTEAGFVRVASNPSSSARLVTPQQALSALTNSCRHARHRFWAETIPYGDAVTELRERIVGHKQVTDAYLLGLAIHKKGKLATLDRGILSLVPSGMIPHDCIELIEG